jgi:hypothetical protein
MDINLPSSDERAESIKEFFQLAKSYTKKDKLLYDEMAHYTFTPPPWEKGIFVVGLGSMYKSRGILFPDFFVYLTKWSANPNERRNTTINWFVKSISIGTIDNYLGDVTRGITYIIEELSKSVISSKDLLGNSAIKELANPWSIIVPLKRVTLVENIPWGWKGKAGCIHIKANLNFEGSREWYFNLGSPMEIGKWVRTMQERVTDMNKDN